MQVCPNTQKVRAARMYFFIGALIGELLNNYLTGIKITACTGRQHISAAGKPG
jgi:hypothetical protein